MKTYTLFYDGGKARLFASEQDSGLFISSLLYCTKCGSWAEGQEIVFDFKVQHFLANSMCGVVEMAETWFKKNISENFTKEASE